MDPVSETTSQRAGANDWRRKIVLSCVGLGLLVIAAVFWQRDLRYSLPTARPTGLVQVPLGSTMVLPSALATITRRGQPLLVNFYNPDCPCSRFNREHLQFLMNRYGQDVQFVSVLETTREVADCGLDMPQLRDPEARIANLFGVYATPQAVLLDARGRLVYRGNYNTSRYCTTPGTQFVRLAIEAMRAARPRRDDAAAEIAYGCPLPGQECHDDQR